MPPPAPSRWFHRHPALALAAVVGLGLVLGVAGIETALRVTAEGPLYEDRGERGARLRELPLGTDRLTVPPAHVVAASNGLTDRPVRFATDPEGFILPARRHPAAERKVAFLGGSTTECAFVADSLRFHALVARGLERRLGRTVDALNPSRSGNHSVHSTLLFTAKVVPHRPDVVVLMHNVNDLTTLLHEGSYWNQNASRSLVVPGDCMTPACDLSRGVRGVTQALVPALAQRVRRARHSGEPRREFQGAVAPPDSAALVDSFRRSLTAFVATARAWGAAPVLMTQANRLTPEPDPALPWDAEQAGVDYATYQVLYAAFNRTTREVASAASVPLIDLAAEIPARRRFLYDAVHLTDDGSRLAARLITARLAEMPELSARGPVSARR